MIYRLTSKDFNHYGNLVDIGTYTSTSLYSYIYSDAIDKSALMIVLMDDCQLCKKIEIEVNRLASFIDIAYVQASTETLLKLRNSNTAIGNALKNSTHALMKFHMGRFLSIYHLDPRKLNSRDIYSWFSKAEKTYIL